jgi:hypothetical protein
MNYFMFAELHGNLLYVVLGFELTSGTFWAFFMSIFIHSAYKIDLCLRI